VCKIIPYHFEYKTYIYHIFSHWKFEVHLKLKELFTSFQSVHRVAWEEPNTNTFGVSHQATLSLPPLTVSQPPAFSSVIAWHSYCSGVFSFLSVLYMKMLFTYDTRLEREVILCAEKISSHAAGRKYTVSEACVHRWWSIKTKLFLCLTNRKIFSGPRRRISPEIDASVLEFFKVLQNKRVSVSREAIISNAKESARNSNIPFKASHEWCDKFMKRKLIITTKDEK
jgi:hypothetical protein